MKPDRLIRVLVADDSSLVREMVCDILTSDPAISIAGEAADGIEAVAKALSLKPDIITMDIEMPLLSGLEAISRIMAVNPVPILVITSLSGVRTAFDAVSKGALDVVEKSDIDPEDASRLVKKVKMLAGVDVVAHQIAMGIRIDQPNSNHMSSSRSILNGYPISDTDTKPFIQSNKTDALTSSSIIKRRIVAIASSTGGPNALCNILSKLPATFPAPIVIAQHVAAGFTQGMAEWLNTRTPLDVTSARNGEVTSSGKVYLNPSESDMRVTRHGVILLSNGGEHQLYHPSCDHLFRSVAESFGQHSVGIILTGMGSDGVAGIKAIQSAGGATLAQDEHSSVVFGMNGLAVSQGAVQRVLTLDMIPDYLMNMLDYVRGVDI